MKKPPQQVEYEIKPKNSFSLGFMELWVYRDLFFHLIKRDIMVKYRHAVLGFIWAVLQPILLMVLFTLVFKKGLSAQSGALPYPIFAYCGLIIWLFFSNGVNGAANSLARNSTILQKIYFPRMVLPFSAICVGFFDFLFAFLVLIGLAIYFDLNFYFVRIISYTFFALSLAIVATASLGLVMAALNAKYRDFQYLLPFVVQLLFFASPIFYHQEHLAGTFFYKLLNFNPLSGPLHLFRIGWSTESPDWKLVGTSTFSAIFLFACGLVVFRKMEAYFADLA